MGYDIHITRAADWTVTDGKEISSREWQALVEEDSELRPDPDNGPHAVVWTGHPEEDAAWLDWFEGNVFTTNPDGPLLEKMLQIAARLGARVVGDENREIESMKDLAL